MSYVLSLVVVATVLGATQASSEEVDLGVSVRWVDNGVTVGTREMSRSLLNIVKRPLPRLTLRGVGLTSKDAVS